MPLSTILTEAYYFFRNNLLQLAALIVPILIVQVAVQLWLTLEVSNMDVNNPQFGGLHMAATMGLLLLFSLLISALTLFLEVRSNGHEPTTGVILKASLNFIPGLLLAGVFSGMAIIAPMVLLAAINPALIFIGMVGSIYLFCRLAYVNFMVVVDRITPLAAIKASFVFSRGIAFKTLLIILLYVPLSIVGGTIAAAAGQVAFILTFFVDVFFAFVGLFVNIALFRLYMVTRSKVEERA